MRKFCENDVLIAIWKMFCDLTNLTQQPNLTYLKVELGQVRLSLVRLGWARLSQVRFGSGRTVGILKWYSRQ